MATGWWDRLVTGALLALLALLAGGAAAAPVGPDLPRLSPCRQDGAPPCSAPWAGTDPAGGLYGALDGRLGIEVAHLPPLDPVSALLPRASRALIADLTGRFRHIARLEAFLAFLAGGDLSLDDLADGDPLVAAALQPLGTRAIAAFLGQAGDLFAVVGSQILRSPGSSSPRRAVSVTWFEAAPPFFLATLAGGTGGTGGGRAGSGGTTPAPLSPGGTLPGVSPAPSAALSPGFPGGGPGGGPGTGPSTGGGDGGQAGPRPDPNPDPDPDPYPGPAPVPLPLPGLLLACTLCGLSPALRRRR